MLEYCERGIVLPVRKYLGAYELFETIGVKMSTRLAQELPFRWLGYLR
jgi:hypothetical protein